MKPLGQINVIPFIDIMLVLLAVVLTTATFVAQGRIPIALPKAGQAQALEKLAALEVNIDAHGEIYLQERLTSVEDLQASLHAVSNKSTPVRLRVDESAGFTHFVTLIDLLKAHGLNNVSIIALRKGG